MLDYRKRMFSEDEERRPLLTEKQLYDECLHDAATIIVAFVLGCEFEDCRLNDDGYKWPTSISRIEIQHSNGWCMEDALRAVGMIHEAGAMAVAKKRGRGPHRINTSETPSLLDDSKVWQAIEALAQFIEDNYEGDGCYGALGTDCHDPGEDSPALELIKNMGLTPNCGWDILRAKALGGNSGRPKLHLIVPSERT